MRTARAGPSSDRRPIHVTLTLTLILTLTQTLTLTLTLTMTRTLTPNPNPNPNPTPNQVIDFGSSCFTRDHLSSYVQSRSYRAPEVILGLPSI